MAIDPSLLQPVSQPQPFNFAALQQSMLQGQARDTNLSAGGMAAQGNYSGAAAAALKGGNPQLAGQVFDLGNQQHVAALTQGAQKLMGITNQSDWNQTRAQIRAAGGNDIGDFANKDKTIQSITDAINPVAGVQRQTQASQFEQTLNKPIAIYPGQTLIRPVSGQEVGGGASSAATPISATEIAQKYNLVLDPDQATRFAQLPDKTRSQTAATLNGSQSINDLPGGYRNPMRLDTLNAARTVDPTYDEVSSKAGNTFETSKTTQQFIANANTASQTVDRLVKLSDKIDRGNITVLNNGLLALKSGTSDPTTKQFLTEYNILGDELGKILGSGQGSDFAIKLGQSLIDPNGSKEAVGAQGAEVKGRIANKLGEYKSQFRQGRTPTVDTTAPPPKQTANRFDQLFDGQGQSLPTAGQGGGVGPAPADVEAEMRRRGFL